MRKLLLAAVLIVSCVCLSANTHAQQIKTWMCPASDAGSNTNAVPAGYVLEALSASFEPDSQVEITIGKDTLRMGNGGANLGLPLVVAGPATVIFRKTATGGQGTIVTYRISPQSK